MTTQWDAELLEGFFEEARDDLAGLEPRLVALRAGPCDESTIHQTFRTIHSIKGNSGFFGIKNANRFADRFENLLDHLRGHVQDISAPVIDLLLRGIDELRGMLEETRRTGEHIASLTPAQQDLLDAIPALTAAGRAEMPGKALRKLEELIQSEAFAAALAHHEVLGGLRTLIDELKPATANVAAAAPSASPVQSFAHACWGAVDVGEAVVTLEAWVQACQTGCATPLPAEALEELANAAPTAPADRCAFEKFRELANMLHQQDLAADPMLSAGLQEHFSAFTASLGSAPPSTAPAKTSATPGAVAGGQKAMIRVGQEKIDQLLGSVGKLIIVLKSYALLENRVAALPAAAQLGVHIKSANVQFDEVLHALQGDALSLRKVECDSLLRTLPRMCTELAEKLHKKVRVETSGEHLEADRSTLDLLKDPLTHILRNSLDHGIETPAARVAAGKTEWGTVRVAASVDKQYFTLVVQDDGGGIDAERVRAKAVESGVITAQQAASMERREVLKLIFAAGLSTAQQQTEVSGRGVGMDVVLSSVTNAGGSAEVESTPGKGTTVTLQIPLSRTLMVMEALLVDITGHRYFVPNAFVGTVLRRDERFVQRMPSGDELVAIDEAIMPIVHAEQTLKHVRSDGIRECPYWIVVRHNGLALCLEVDRVCGIEEIVVTELPHIIRGIECLQGAAITNEGAIALVLHVPWLLGTIAAGQAATSALAGAGDLR